jgi:hypothetical protein
MRKLFFLVVAMFSIQSFSQDIIATTEDGKKVILKDNKTWEYDQSKTEIKNTCVIEKGFK